MTPGTFDPGEQEPSQDPTERDEREAQQRLEDVDDNKVILSEG